MNRLPGIIKGWQSAERLTRVDIQMNNDLIQALMIETPQTNPLLENGRAVWVVIKESDLAISRNGTAKSSISNRLEATIERIEPGTLLCRIHLDYKGTAVQAIIPKRSAEDLELQSGEQVQIWIRMNEIMLMDQTGNEE